MEEYRHKSRGRGGRRGAQPGRAGGGGGGDVAHVVFQLVSLLLDRENATEASQGTILGKTGREGHWLLHTAVWEAFLCKQ